MKANTSENARINSRDYIDVVVNGKTRSMGEGATVAALLAQLGLQPMQVVIEYGGEPLPREQFAQTILRAGDRLEIAQMVGGG